MIWVLDLLRGIRVVNKPKSNTERLVFRFHSRNYMWGQICKSMKNFVENEVFLQSKQTSARWRRNAFVNLNNSKSMIPKKRNLEWIQTNAKASTTNLQFLLVFSESDSFSLNNNPLRLDKIQWSNFWIQRYFNKVGNKFLHELKILSVKRRQSASPQRKHFKQTPLFNFNMKHLFSSPN